MGGLIDDQYASLTSLGQYDVRYIDICIFMTFTQSIYHQSTRFNQLSARDLGFQSLFQLSTVAFDCLIFMRAERIT